MRYWLHPEAAEEHKKQVTHYEEIQAGLGKRYHSEFQNVLALVCARQIAHALCLPRTFDVPCSRFFTLTLSTAKSMDWFKCWPLPIIVASQAIGWLGFNWLIDPTFAGHRQR